MRPRGQDQVIDATDVHLDAPQHAGGARHRIPLQGPAAEVPRLAEARTSQRDGDGDGPIGCVVIGSAPQPRRQVAVKELL
jgi:hypothetical protein